MIELPNLYWTHLLWAALLLLGIYFILKITKELFSKAYFLGTWKSALQHIIHSILLVYEVIVLLILLSLFILINPPFHGLMVFFFLLAAFPYFRDYLSGRLVQLDEQLQVGQRVRTGELDGILNHLDYFGIHLKNREGNHKISYYRLMKNGYALLSPEAIGGLYQLLITPNQTDQKKSKLIARLEDLLITAPYLDWRHRPEINLSESEPTQLEARILVQEDVLVNDLITLIEEWGYEVVLRVK